MLDARMGVGTTGVRGKSTWQLVRRDRVHAMKNVPFELHAKADVLKSILDRRDTDCLLTTAPWSEYMHRCLTLSVGVEAGPECQED